MRSSVRGALGLLISAGLVWWLVAKSDIDWRAAWDATRHANVWLLLLSSAAATAMFALRAPRWRIILPAVDPPLRFSHLWEASMIGQMATNVLPARAGELARPFALWRMDPRIPFSTGFASVVVDRAFDGLIVLLMMVVAMLDPAFPRDAAIRGRPVVTIVWFVVAALIVGLGGLYAIVFAPERLMAIAGAVVRRIAPRLEPRVMSMLGRFAAGLSVLRDARRFAMVFLWSVAHWLLCAVSYWLAFKAIGLVVPTSASLFIVACIVLAVAIPSTPGFAGVFEAAAVGALVIYGADRSVALALAVTYHVITWLPVTALGFVYSLRMGLRLSELKAISPEPPKP